MPFNDKQIIAIEASGDNIIVSAGAGSGKTAVLTEKVLHFIKNKNYKINEFLILTFTNLAAGEMKDRIRKALKNANLEEANYVDTADITTFDAYALSLVKKYHTKLGISKNVSIVDSSVISVRKRQIIEEIFEENYKNNTPDFTNMIKRFCFKDDADLINLVLLMHNKACLNLNFNDYLDTFIDKYFSNELIDELTADYTEEILKFRDSIASFIHSLPHEPISKKNPIDFKNAVVDFFQAFLDSNDYDSLTKNYPFDFKVATPSKLSEEQRKICADFKEYVRKIVTPKLTKLPIGIDAFRDYYKVNIPIASTLIDITKQLEEKIQKYKREKNTFEFNDIAKMALDLVNNHNDIRDSIKNSLKLIMIDEYQDTSDIQENFINQIQNNNVYMVGDIKQSIYRFRNAKSEIFANKYNTFREDDIKNNRDSKDARAIDLTKNYRSRAEVLDDINYIFKQIMHQDMGGANYRRDHMIEFGNELYTLVGNDNENKHSEYLLYSANPKIVDISELEAEIIAKDIVKKINNGYKVFNKSNDNPALRNCIFSDFCILMDRGSKFDTYVKIFSEYKIPLYVENDEDISSSDVLRVVSNLIKLIKFISINEYEDDFKHAFVSIARSFLFSYSDERIYDIATNDDYINDPIILKIKDIMYQNNHLPIYNLIKTIIFELDIYNSFIKIGNIEKYTRHMDTLLSMFKQMSDLDYSIDDFITYLKYVNNYNLKINLSAVGSNKNSVKIMNIHKSKGLEFPIIYFSGLDAKYNRMDYENEFNISDKYGLIVPAKDGQENILKKKHAEYDCLHDLSEKIRLFYVDVTRAREKMYFVLNVDEGTYMKYYLDKFNSAYDYHRNYIEENKLNDDQIFEYVYGAYYDKKMDPKVFRKFVNKYNFRLPIGFSMNEKYTLDLVRKNLEIEDEVREWAKNYIKNIEIEIPEFEQNEEENELDEEKKIVIINKLIIKDAYTKYQNKEIKKLHLMMICDELGYIFNFSELNEKDVKDIPFSDSLLSTKFNPGSVSMYKPEIYALINLFISGNKNYSEYEYYKNNSHSLLVPNFDIDKLEFETLIYLLQLHQFELDIDAVNSKSNIENEEVDAEFILSLFKFNPNLKDYSNLDQFKMIYKRYKEGKMPLKDLLILKENIPNPYDFDGKRIIYSTLKLDEKIALLKGFVNEIYQNDLENELNKINIIKDYNLFYKNLISMVKSGLENFNNLTSDIDLNLYNHADIIDLAYNSHLYLEYLASINNKEVDVFIESMLKLELSECINYINSQFDNILNNLTDSDIAMFVEEYFECGKKEIEAIIEEQINHDIFSKFEYLFFEKFNLDFQSTPIKYDEENYINEHIINYYLKLLINTELSDELLVKAFDLLNCDINPSFLKLSKEERALFDRENIYTERGDDIYLKVDEDVNFASIMRKFIGYRKFIKNSVEMYIKEDNLEIEDNYISNDLIIEELDINHDIIKIGKASKDINLNSNKKNMEFGNTIHLLMEVIDFKNPNLDSIENVYYRGIINKFLNWEIVNNINHGDIYKEYEFFDEINNVNGIIDLMIVYDKYIDIIDYKTKNIDDIGYEKQLNTYKKYIQNKFNKPVNTYLYSLIDGISKLVE